MAISGKKFDFLCRKTIPKKANEKKRMERRNFVLKLASLIVAPIAAMVVACQPTKKPKRKKMPKPGKPIPCPCS